MPETPQGAGVLSKRVDLLAPIEECCRVPRAGLRWRSRPPAMVPASTSFNTAPCPVSAIKVAPPTTDVGGADTIGDPQWRHPSAKRVCRGAVDSGRLPSMKSSFNAPNSCYFRPSPCGACCSPDAARQGRHPAQRTPRPRWWLGCGLVMSIGSSGTTFNGRFGAGR